MMQVQREDTVKEYFIPARFIQSQEWDTYSLQPSCPIEISRCNYTRDYIKYIGEKYVPDRTYHLNFSKIIHSTHQSELLSIIMGGGFKPGRKIIPNCDINSFVWFGIKIGQEEVDALKNDYRRQLNNGIFVDLGLTDNEIDCRSIVNSPCFEPMSRYGEFKLAFEIQNVINAYRRQFCPMNQETRERPKPEFRMLGTFIYKMETMHTVLVCPPGTTGTNTYPLLGQSEMPVICVHPENEGTFIWCPHSTGDKDNAAADQSKRGPFRRWEHVTFAFYVPAGTILKLDNVSSDISVCIFLNQTLNFEPSLINVTIGEFLDTVGRRSAIKIKRWWVNLLIRSLRGYLDEEKVFEKMDILYMYQPLDLDTVVDRAEELLDGQEFDWSPLIEWMKDVQQTTNTAVLSSILKYLDKKREICTTKLQEMALHNDYTAGPHQLPQL